MIKKYIRQISCLFFLFLLLMVSGCLLFINDREKPGIAMTSEAFKNFSGDYKNTEYFKTHKPASIAVLPFRYAKEKDVIPLPPESPACVIRKGMYNHIASLPFKDLELLQTDRLLKNAGLTSVQKLNDMIDNHPRKLRSILGVDAVITGEVTHFDRIFLGIYSQVAVGCSVKMRDLKTGNLLWEAEHVSRAHAGGASLSPVGLAMAAVASVWNLRQDEMLSQTDELFREMVSTIDVPTSDLMPQLEGPRIDLFAVMNHTGKPFTTGKKIAFRMIGNPDCQAYVDIGELKTNIELSPVSHQMKQALQAEVLEAIKKNYQDTGHDITPELIAAVEQELSSREIYEGDYTVVPGEQAYGETPKAYLVNSLGERDTEIDIDNLIDIDSRPPLAPRRLSAESLDNKVKLSWVSNPEDDLAGYEIWSSNTPYTGYTLSGKSETSEALIGNLLNFKQIFFQVRAVDKAGNAGEFTNYVKVIPLPEPELYDLKQPGPALKGKISEKVILVAEKNPYTVLSDLEVIPGGVLYIEPGVEILFAPQSALIINGGDIMAYGRRDARIRLTPKTDKSDTGLWKGVILKQANRSFLSYVSIESAITGLTIENCATTIIAGTITQSSQAGIHLKDNAKPNISCSVFSDNQGLGAMLIEGEGVAPVIHNNIFQRNEPFQVQSYTPLKIDLTHNYWGSAEPDTEHFLGNLLWQPALSEPPTCK